MEIGSPSLYSEANRVAREMDSSYLQWLGPFHQALSKIILWAEVEKKPEDKIKTGNQIGGLYNNLGGVYLLWTGSQMKHECLIPYKLNVGFEVRFPGNISCYRKARVALGFALDR